MPDGWNEAEIRRTLKKRSASAWERGRRKEFTAPELAFEKLLPMADYILAEADGSSTFL